MIKLHLYSHGIVPLQKYGYCNGKAIDLVKISFLKETHNTRFTFCSTRLIDY